MVDTKEHQPAGDGNQTSPGGGGGETQMAGKQFGRRPLLDRETLDTVYSMLREGHYFVTCQGALGISDSTWHNWTNKGLEVQQAIEELYEQAQEAGTEIADSDVEKLIAGFTNGALYLDFVGVLKKGQAEAENKALGIINKSALEGTWQAAAWFLERRHRSRWGRPDKAETPVVNAGDALNQFLTGVNQLAQAAAQQGAEEDEA